MDARDAIRGLPDAVEVDVLVAPRASRNAVIGMHDGRVKVQLAAPPVDGAANAALVELLADALGVPRRSIALVRGQTGKRKTVRITGLDAATVRQRLVPDCPARQT